MHHQVTPASRSEATSALRALFEAFPVDRKEGAGGAATYLIAVEGYSVNAIHKAVKRLIRGEVAGVDMRFLPTPAQVSSAARYCEDLIAPAAPRVALPAPEDAVLTEAEWARRGDQARAARERFGVETHVGETVTDREAVPEARLAELDRAVAKVAATIKAEGWPKLSLEALRTCIPDPAEQYDAWDKARNPTPEAKDIAA